MELNLLNKKSSTKFLKNIKENGWSLTESTYICLSESEKEFFDLEFSGINSFPYYLERLKAIGFCGMDNVLDIACGMGQWSLSLAKLNNNIIGSDINTGRLLIGRELASSMNINNVNFFNGSAENINLDDASCDAIFCYGAFMFTDMKISLKEFRRVLKPGGKIYLNVNSIGWYLYLIFERGLNKSNITLIKASLKIIMRSFFRKSRNIVVSPSKLKSDFKKAGFIVKGVGPEGTLRENSSQKRLKQKYLNNFWGFPMITEILAIKN